MIKKILLTVGLGMLISGSFAQWPSLTTDTAFIHDMCFTSKGTSLAVADGHTVKFFDVESRKLIQSFEPRHSKAILAIDLAKDSSIVVTGGKDSLVLVRNMKSGVVLREFTDHDGIITNVALSPGGRLLASAGTDDRVLVYDLSSGKLLYKLEDHTDDVTTVAFSPDGQWIASAGADKTIQLYDARQGKLLQTLKGHKSWVRDLTFTHDSREIISVGDDHRIIRWNVEDVENICIGKKINLCCNWLLSVDSFGQRGTYALGSQGGKIRIMSPYQIYRENLPVPVQKVLFRPNTGHYLYLAVATRGRGVLLMKAGNMKSKERN